MIFWLVTDTTLEHINKITIPITNQFLKRLFLICCPVALGIILIHRLDLEYCKWNKQIYNINYFFKNISVQSLHQNLQVHHPKYMVRL
jgi:hypothetical protein